MVPWDDRLLGSTVFLALIIDYIFSQYFVTRCVKSHKNSPSPALVFPIFLKVAETWAQREMDRRDIDALEMWCWMRMFGVSWSEFRTNAMSLFFENWASSSICFFSTVWNAHIFPSHSVVGMWLWKDLWTREGLRVPGHEEDRGGGLTRQKRQQTAHECTRKTAADDQKWILPNCVILYSNFQQNVLKLLIRKFTLKLARNTSTHNLIWNAGMLKKVSCLWKSLMFHFASWLEFHVRSLVLIKNCGENFKFEKSVTGISYLVKFCFWYSLYVFF